ncbi:Ig-like domain-containing protein [Massilia pseudoviolaceinigra]|uniref:Ig-like domain-containing protein n=1 Tax=Massilia pseudoviolaceinigra TaxID=3057165 RepID=UPI00279642B8|nr:Ig-like domain-containing protein [Massilia sp. CCM 9206]MDQ1921364.1 Ig-like domain-containing protein [Massilia sp. CCM 9206]
MRHLTTFKLFRPLAIALALSASHAVMASETDHQEFEATLHVPYATSSQARVFTLAFEYPHVERQQEVSWKLELVSPAGQVVQRWHGVQRMFQKPVDVKVRWAGRAGLPDGVYKVRMQAVSNDAAERGREPDLSEESVDRLLAAGAGELVEQSWDLALGKTAKAAMPAFRALPTNKTDSKAESKSGELSSVQMAAPAPGSLPYTVYFANLHSQTNHSDGGGALGSCSGSQSPQSAALGPADAFAYARNKGLDILATSEHNHMFDGSDGTNASASPATAKALYKSGLTAAADFNAAHPDFLGVYGLEWGVISNGGHLNIFNSPELLQWELNSSGQLIGDTLTPKGDYSGLYTLMRQRGWVGQFNHPSSSGQFLINGVPLGYTADGDQAMVLCEVLNTSAFSTNTTETETGRSTFEGACNKALESGFHIAFATNQDNHCANWGASYTNRTGVLIPNGTPLSQASFIEALKARRVFATMDKTSQLVLTANGRVMGERFSNSGPLNLIANFASTSGKTVSTVSIVEGVPGRNGTVSQLSTTANTTITPSVGEHFYYAKLTQDDGKILWSAPIWVTQTNGGGDTTAPRVTAGQSGSSGNISFSASASDDVGVTRVEFYVDNQLKATSSAAPYSATINSATLSNGSHSLVAKAYDAAGNVGTSAAVTFSVSNASGGDTTPPAVSASANGSSGTISLAATASDNGGINRVEFYVDNVLKGTDTTSPYALSLNSATLSNGSHQLTAKAFDVALNSAVSAPVSFSVSNAGAAQQLLFNSGFESGASAWVATSGVITSSGQAAHGGSWKAALNGAGLANTDSVYQQVTIPSTATSAKLAFWLKVVSSETTTTSAYDKLKVQVRSGSNAVLATLATYSNLNKGSSYVQKTFDLSAYKGQTVRIYFEGVEGSTIPTAFLIDDVTLTTQ